MMPLSGHPGLTHSLKTIKGVGPQIEKALLKRGLKTSGDLLGLMPLRYQDRRRLTPIGDLAEDQEALVSGRILELRQGRFPTGRRYFELSIGDETGRINALWFSLPAQMRQGLNKGERVQLFGRVGSYKDRLQLVHPEIAKVPENYLPRPEIRPVYPELEDIRPGVLRRIMAQACGQLAVQPAVFPPRWLEEQALADPTTLLRTLHAPPPDRPGPLPRPEDSKAWRSLALFELLFIQLSLARSRSRLARSLGFSSASESPLKERFLAGLPFTLTQAQQKALKEIARDLSKPRPMSRLLQGEVGSGKTVVALAAAMIVVDAGRQAAFMAPTELLARQHFQTLAPQAERLRLTADLLVGSLPEAVKSQIRQRLAAGRTQIVVGTHALIAAGVEFKSLGLAVIDEQHRFGVAQRLALRRKADQPDILVMSATPIPRSLALTLYGDLDLSTIEELPPGRQPVKTRLFKAEDREEAYRILAEEINTGGQAYIIAPRISSNSEDEEGDDLASAEDLYNFIRRRVMPQGRVGLVHGRLKPGEQDQLMTDFTAGRLQALVATTVVEVGLDVPQATVVLVESADSFGLAQLHQLRGRVGRGNRQAQCLLVAGASGGGLNRLRIMTRTNDGFVLAEEDLKKRGPGDRAGFRQSGLPPFIWARLPEDLPLLIKAKDLAEAVIAKDPDLEAPEFKLVREIIDNLDKCLQADLIEAG